MIETISQSLNILIVDDEVNIRKTLSVCLETEGYKVIAVSNFQDALAEASRSNQLYSKTIYTCSGKTGG
jgi:DNA-binding response OmpR family regulator